MKRSNILSALLMATLLASCTSYRAYQEGQDREKVQDWDTAVTNYAKALEVDPDNLRYKIALQRAKLEASRVHFEKGKALRAAGQNEAAVIELQLTTQLDPTNQYAGVELSKAAAAVQAAQDAENDKFAQMKKRADVTKAQPPELVPGSNEPISLSFPHDTSIKDIYRALANAFGINILFDPGVKDEKISIELRDVTAQQALERVMQAGGHFYKVLDPKTIIVVPDTAQNRRDYEDLVIRTFYLSNGDAEQVTNVLRTMLEARNVFPLKALNAITIRDTADKVRIAEKIIEANDKAKAEVVVDVELLQLDLRKLQAIGPKLSSYGTTQGLNVLDAAGKPLSSLTLSQMRGLNSSSWSFTIPSVSYDFAKTNTDTKLLAKPELRISEGEKATLHIGDKVPIKTASFNTSGTVGGGVIGTSYNYQDVGIKITIEPRVHHNREVTLKLNVEVSNVSGPGGADLPPTISTRMIESTIRLKDGETNFLAGLIRRDDTITNTGFAFLSDIPILGKLFSNLNTDRKDTDLVLTMTPHIIRIPDITEDDLAPMWVGTTNNITFRGVSPRVESNSNLDAFTPVERVPDEEQQFEEGGEEPQPPPATEPQQQVPPDPFNFAPKKPEPPSPNGSIDQNQSPVKQMSAQVAPGNTTAAVRYNTRMQPRIAPQPSTLSLKPGMEQRWSVFGMDLDSLTTSRIVFHYDPQALDISRADIGSALKVDPTAPPVVKISPDAGTVTVQSSNGDPLTFISGGRILDLYVRGGITGKTMLVLEPMNVKDANGNMIECAVSGGRATVE